MLVTKAKAVIEFIKQSARKDVGVQKRKLAGSFASCAQRHKTRHSCITLDILEEVSPYASICFHGLNHRLHRITALELLLDGCGDTPFGASATP